MALFCMKTNLKKIFFNTPDDDARYGWCPLSFDMQSMFLWFPTAYGIDKMEMWGYCDKGVYSVTNIR